jgi:hypothetical protein
MPHAAVNSCIKRARRTSARGRFLHQGHCTRIGIGSSRSRHPDQSTGQDHAWELRLKSREPWRPHGEKPCVQEGRTRQVIPPVCGGIDAHAAQLTAGLRRVSDTGQITTALYDCGTTDWALASKAGGPRSQYRPSLMACFTREKSRSDGITQLLRKKALTKNLRKWLTQ